MTSLIERVFTTPVLFAGTAGMLAAGGATAYTSGQEYVKQRYNEEGYARRIDGGYELPLHVSQLSTLEIARRGWREDTHQVTVNGFGGLVGAMLLMHLAYALLRRKK